MTNRPIVNPQDSNPLFQSPFIKFWEGMGVHTYSSYTKHGFFLINHQCYNEIHKYLDDHFELRVKIQQGKFKIIIDCIGESFGDSFFKQVIDDLTPLCKKYNFPVKSIIFVDGAATQLSIKSKYFISMGVDSFEYLSHVWFGEEPQCKKTFTRQYINMGRKPHAHRIVFAHLLEKYLDLNNTSLGESSIMVWNDNFNWANEAAEYMKTYHPNTNIDIPAIAQMENAAPYNLDPINLSHEQSFKFSPMVIHEAFLYVVNETYSTSDRIFLTEKTWRPIQAKMPFVIYGNAGSIKELHNLGYKTFGNWWDESYDSLIGYDRAMAIIDIIKTFDDKNLSDLYNEMKPTLDYNFQIFHTNYMRPINKFKGLLNTL